MNKPDQPFRILDVRRVEPRPDGTERRNIYFVGVEVDGVAHQIGLRRSNGRLHFPQDLKGHPLTADIATAVAMALKAEIETEMVKWRAERPTRRQ